MSGQRAGQRRWWQSFSVLVLAAIIVAAILRPVPPKFMFSGGGDCVRYRDWSRQVVQHGFAALPMLVEEWQKKWVGFPPPTRWTWLVMIAGVMKLWPHPADDYSPIILISWLASVLTLVPLALWLRRIAPPILVAFALLLTATSPLQRGLARMPLPDALQCFSSLMLLWLVTEWAFTQRRALLVAQGFFAFWLITVRETGLLVVMAAMLLAWFYARRPTEEMTGLAVRTMRQRAWPIVALFAGCVVAALSTVPAAGGVAALWRMIVVYTTAMVRTGNIALVSGPPYRYFIDFSLMAPLMVVVAIAAMARLFGDGRLRELTFPTALFGGFLYVTNSFLPKTLRYVMSVEILLRVFAAAGVYLLWAGETKRRRQLAIGLLVALVAVDEGLWYALWAFDQVYDPVTWSVVRALQMIPH